MKPDVKVYEGDKDYVFISYAHKDSGIVYPVIEELARRGCRVWYDEGIPLVSDYGGVLYDHIERCGAFIIFKSRNSVKSEDVCLEITHANNLKKRIIQIVIDIDAQYPKNIRYFLHDRLQYLSMDAEPRVFYGKLIAQLQNCMDPTAAVKEAERKRARQEAERRRAEQEAAERRRADQEAERRRAEKNNKIDQYSYMSNSSGNGVTITKYLISDPRPVIPREIDGRTVTAIGDKAFYECGSLTSVTIPDSVTSIGDEAFYECRSLTSVTIPDSVTSIGNSAFYGCTYLKNITLPKSVKHIGSYAFSGTAAARPHQTSYVIQKIIFYVFLILLVIGVPIALAFIHTHPDNYHVEPLLSGLYSALSGAGLGFIPDLTQLSTTEIHITFSLILVPLYCIIWLLDAHRSYFSLIFEFFLMIAQTVIIIVYSLLSVPLLTAAEQLVLFFIGLILHSTAGRGLLVDEYDDFPRKHSKCLVCKSGEPNIFSEDNVVYLVVLPVVFLILSAILLAPAWWCFGLYIAVWILFYYVFFGW